MLIYASLSLKIRGCTYTNLVRYTLAVGRAQFHAVKREDTYQYSKEIPIQLYTAIRKNKGISRTQITDLRRQEDIRCYWRKFAKYIYMQLGEEDLRMRDIEKSQFRQALLASRQLRNLGISR